MKSSTNTKGGLSAAPVFEFDCEVGLDGLNVLGFPSLGPFDHIELHLLAEGPDQVKARVQELLGLSYEHFTQSVLLPQGRFAEFLHAKPGDRQDLLVQLLAFGVYEQMGQG